MNNKQRARLDSCNRVQTLCVQYATALNPIAFYPAEKLILDSRVANINIAVQTQTAPFGGESDASLTAKTAMIGTILRFCRRGLVRRVGFGSIPGNYNVAVNITSP